MANPILKTALFLAERGIKCFPVAPGSKVPLKNSGGVHDATCDHDRLRQWFEEMPTANLAATPGSEYVVVDLDCKNGRDGRQSWEKLVPRRLDTLSASTPNKGLHLWFESPYPFRNSAGEFGEGIDIRGQGGYVVCPPSRIPAGTYQWVGSRNKEILPVPEELLQRLSRDGGRAPITSRPKSSSGLLEEGTRNDTLFRLGCSLKANTISDDEILVELLKINTTICKPPLGSREVARIALSVSTYSGQYTLTESGNAERFADRYRGNVLWVPERKFWLVPNNGVWERDKKNICIQHMKSVAKEITAEAYTEKDKNLASSSNQFKKKVNWGKRTESAAVIQNSLKLATSELQIIALAEEFDQYPMRLVVENGVVNLETGKLEPHDLDLKLTKRSPVRWDKNANCPRWVEFLSRIFNGNQELIGYIQRFAGYLLTGMVSAQIFPIFWGTGKNGKTTLLLVWREILGDYACQVQPELIQHAHRQPNAATPSLARLVGMRFVTTLETEGNHRLSESLVKQMTGGDPIEARGLYQDPFEYMPEFKFVLATNHKPIIRGTDYAIWRRIHLVPFNERISDAECIPDYHKELLEEKSGILNWMVVGCLQWQSFGLDAPEEVLAATECYRGEQDTITQFLREELFDSKVMNRTDVYKRYLDCCALNRVDPIKSKDFYLEMDTRGYKLKKVRGERLLSNLPVVTPG